MDASIFPSPSRQTASSHRKTLSSYGLHESTQTALIHSVFQKRLRDALREGEFRSRFCDLDAPVALSKELPADILALLFTRRRLLDLLRPGFNAFISTF